MDQVTQQEICLQLDLNMSFKGDEIKSIVSTCYDKARATTLAT